MVVPRLVRDSCREMHLANPWSMQGQHSARPGRSWESRVTIPAGGESSKACSWRRCTSQRLKDKQKSVRPSLPPVTHKQLSLGTCPDSQICAQSRCSKMYHHWTKSPALAVHPRNNALSDLWPEKPKDQRTALLWRS